MARARAAAKGRPQLVRQGAEEVAAAVEQQIQQAPGRFAEQIRVGGGQGELGAVRRVQAHPAVAAGQRTVTLPEHLAAGRELVQHGRAVVAHPRRQHQRLDRAGRQRDAGQLLDRAQHPVDAAKLAHPLPAGQESREIPGGDGFHGIAQGGHRASPQQLEDAGMAELGAAAGFRRLAGCQENLVRIGRNLATAGRNLAVCGRNLAVFHLTPAGWTQIAFHEAVGRGEPAQHVPGDRWGEPKRGSELKAGEGGVGAGVAGGQIAQWIVDRFEEGVRDAQWGRDPEGVAQLSGVFHGSPVLGAGELNADHPAFILEPVQPGCGRVEIPGLFLTPLTRCSSRLLPSRR